MIKEECPGLAPEPHVAIVELCDDDEFLVIGSDGLYEVFGNHKQLVKVVKDTLRATGSVDETVKTIIRGTCCMCMPTARTNAPIPVTG